MKENIDAIEESHVAFIEGNYHLATHGLSMTVGK